MTEHGVDFIIPLRHPENIRDRCQAISILSQTVQSVLNQKDSAVAISIVSNPMDELAQFEPFCNIIPVELPPNRDHEEVPGPGKNKAVRRDKGMRLYAGLERSRLANVMLLDDDDFLHRSISSFVTEQAHPNGWVIDKGYHWTSGSAYLFPQNRFHRSCGSCHILRRDLLLKAIDSYDDLYQGIDLMLGSHVFLADRCAALGFPLSPLPFRAAIKRRDHANAHSQTGAIDLRLFLGYVAKTARQFGLSEALAQLRAVTRYDRNMDEFGLPPRML